MKSLGEWWRRGVGENRAARLIASRARRQNIDFSPWRGDEWQRRKRERVI